MARSKNSFRLNPRFKLDNQNSRITLVISSRIFKHGRFLYSLSIPAKNGEWDSKRQIFKTGKTFPNGERRNKVLSNIMAKVQEVIEKADGTPITKEILRGELDVLLGYVPVEEKKDFFEFYLRELERNTKSWKSQSIKALKTTYNLLKKFEKETNFNISFSNLNLEFYSNFTSWLNGKSYSKNYVGKAIRNIRTLLNMAEELNYPVNPDFHKKSFKVLREDSDNVYVTKDELQLLRQHDFQNSSYKRCRDLFLFLCYTALRISDVKRLNEGSINNEYIQIRSLKTEQIVTIPLNREAKQILARYNNVLPRFPDQYFNRLIKEVCKEAKIKEIINVSQTRGGNRVYSKKEKWELVSSHTGRRTFATNMYLEGEPIQKIMAYTGHKTEMVFRQYIKADQHTIMIELNQKVS